MATSIINNVQPYGLKRIKKSESTQHAKMWVNTAHISYTSSTWATSFSIYKFDKALLILEINLKIVLWNLSSSDALVNCFFNIMG